MLTYYGPIALIVLSNIVYHVCSKSTPENINPLAALIVTYLVSATASLLLYFGLNRGGDLLHEYHALNWTSLALGVSLVGLEAGTIYMYKVGWNVSSGELVYASILAVVLVLIGVLFYHEAITPKKIMGILVCMVGLYLINSN